MSDAWNVRQNRLLGASAEARRICGLDGCHRDLMPAQRKYCSAGHADRARQRRHRERGIASVPCSAKSHYAYYAILIAEDGQRRRRGLGRLRRSILKRQDAERVFDRVRPGEGRLPDEDAELRHFLAPRHPGSNYSAAERERLGDGTCAQCKRFLKDCASLTDHQDVRIRIVIAVRDLGSAERAA